MKKLCLLMATISHAGSMGSPDTILKGDHCPSSFRGDNFQVNFCESSVFSNGRHFLWWAGLSDIILKGDHLNTISQ